ncbi:granulocyte colony-stimulating factor isoform X1 [Eptesicus fuscus]|uniref:granulocyte colony-stimulating factor isoform X1 n=1 Tax=Eptesicus fuscus TaxID=29078 RepID=UPI00240433A5|nr:granulocyte colony-stimulating factor isoform X1 [Eptesicus fuscus]
MYKGPPELVPDRARACRPSQTLLSPLAAQSPMKLMALQLLLWHSALWTVQEAAPLGPAHHLPETFLLKCLEQVRKIQADVLVMQERLCATHKLCHPEELVLLRHSLGIPHVPLGSCSSQSLQLAAWDSSTAASSSTRASCRPWQESPPRWAPPWTCCSWTSPTLPPTSGSRCKTWGWPLACRPPRAPCPPSPSPRPSSAGQGASWWPPTCRASWSWPSASCATSPRPEQTPPHPMYLSLFNIYLNLIFKDREERGGVSDSWALPSPPSVVLSVAERKLLPSCPLDWEVDR